jgi:hypothetical protein
MQVSQVNDHISHAVIGGEQSIEFGISSSAEFFNILSSTLYKDQILAVVREVLCNAWDAHIEAEVTDKPVEITLTGDKFTIRDYGNGIHKDDMGTIYGTYGNSTKKNDSKQTGGFGLGCKAPFAYVEHFEVQSSHTGVKTIYNLTKSSAQAMGKPGITPIASFPTTDSGLQVSLRVKCSADHSRFKALIKRIASNGDMNMTLNGEPIEKLEFDTSKSNYILVLAQLLDSHSRIMIRYGNVIYPVEQTKEVSNEFSKIEQHLTSLRGRGYNNYSIIFQAPPHSISVTPSRESLSMQEHTIKTVKGLMQGFLDTLATSFKVECQKFAVDSVKQAVAEEKIGALLSNKACLPTVVAGEYPNQVTDLVTMAKCYMAANYTNDVNFIKKDIQTRLEAMVQAKLLDRGIVYTYLKALAGVKNSFYSHSYSRVQEENSWLQRHVMGPLATKLVKAGLDLDRMFVYDPEDVNNPDRYNQSTKLPLVPIIKAKPTHLFAALPYLRNIVVVASARNSMVERAYKHDIMKKYGTYPGFLFYHAGTKMKEKEKALEFFKKSGFVVVDLTVKQEWEIGDNLVSVTPVPKKPAKKGAVALKSIQGTHRIDTHLSRKDDAPRIEDPEFIIQISVRDGLSTRAFMGWTPETTQHVLDLFGDKGGITATSSSTDLWIKKGCKHLTDYVRTKVCEYIVSTPSIQDNFAFAPERSGVPTSSKSEYIITCIWEDKPIRDALGISFDLSEQDKKYLELWDFMQYQHNDEITAAKAHLATITVSQVCIDLVKKIESNKLLHIIDIDELGNVLENHASNPTQADKAREIFIGLINM